MLKHLILILHLLFAINTECQTFSRNYLGPNFTYYKDVLFKIDKESKNGFENIYSFRNELISDASKGIYKSTFKVTKSFLEQVYRVDSIIDLNNKYFVFNTDGSPMIMNPYFVLKNVNTNQELFFKYNIESENEFPFLTSEILFDREDILPSIRSSKSTKGDTTFRFSTFTDVYTSPMLVLKEVKTKNKTNYILLISVYGPELAMKGKSITLEYENGLKLKRKLPTYGFADLSKFLINCEVPLNKKELNKLSTNIITKVTLNGHTANMDRYESIRFKASVKTLLDN